ncbi:hypothetical protein GE061_000370 [Apolygus lucorum]|uniref:Ig-like domain-containing protein n=1 Tax=Apolygus lucorum TaxID=248454 RepID=A0A8S9Y4F4_APOLU|nr:hypothetical protein GE061_000370 [Apolygus lucorum]
MPKNALIQKAFSRVMMGKHGITWRYLKHGDLLFREVALPPVDAVLGRSAELPCNIEPDIRDDRVYMVLWFREGEPKPLYR